MLISLIIGIVIGFLVGRAFYNPVAYTAPKAPTHDAGVWLG